MEDVSYSKIQRNEETDNQLDQETTNQTEKTRK